MRRVHTHQSQLTPAQLGSAIMDVIPTGVSLAYCCTMSSGNPGYQPAEISRPDGEPSTVAWLDELLRGGLRVPKSGHRPLTLLIAGPPGSGKTTLAMEMAVRTSQSAQQPLSSLFVSTDQDTDLMVENAHALLGNSEDRAVLPFDMATLNGDSRPLVAVCGRDKIPPPSPLSAVTHKVAPMALRLAEIGLVYLKGWHIVVDLGHGGAHTASNSRPNAGKVVRSTAPHIVVIDGLNSVDPGEQPSVFAEFLKLVPPSVRMIAFILDSSPDGVAHKPWEYSCDLILQLNYGLVDNYFLRSIEIVKARYQEHVWGRHQLKIYSAAKRSFANLDDDAKAAVRRNHPYRNDGGVFIYPSIHYYLSMYKRGGHTGSPNHDSTLPESFSQWLHKGLAEAHRGSGHQPETATTGLPKGRCTAFIGTRGGHKSHLGYLHLLHRLHDHQESGLIISLRDDESMTRRTMDRILRTEVLGNHVQSVHGQTRISDILKGLENDDHFEILYFHPGYITPEEFFHRVYISIQRLNRRGKPLTILFNSLDQLASRFPLCAREGIFVPGLIEMFTGEAATSIFIAVDEPGQPPEQYGLLPMADLILAFQPHRFSGEDYWRILSDAHNVGPDINPKEEEELRGTFREEIVVQVVRFSGGQRAGARGILELAYPGSIYGGPGLHFTPLSDHFNYTDRRRPK